MSDPTIHPAEGLPPKRAASLAALVALVAVIAGGGWGAYHALVKSAPMAIGNDFQPDPLRYNWRARAAAPAVQQAVVVSPGQVVTVRASGLVLNATGRPDGSWRLNFLHRGSGPAPDPQAVELLNHRRRILEAKRPPADLKLTDAQRSALAAMPSNPPELAQPTADRAIEICKLLVKMTAADAKAAPLKSELEQIVTAAGKGDRAAIVATYAQRATQIRAILSPEQVQALLTGVARPATPKPAAAPAVPPVVAPAATPKA